MGCTIYLLSEVKNGDGIVNDGIMWDGDSKKRLSIPVVEIPDAKSPGDVTYDDIVRAIMSSGTGQKELIALIYDNAKEFDLKEKDLKNMTFVSNTTVEDLFSHFNIPEEFYPGVNGDLASRAITEGYTLLVCNKFDVNRNTYSGMYTGADGRKVVIIKNYGDVKRFFGYLLARDAVNDAVRSGAIDMIGGDDRMTLETLAQGYGKADISTLLRDFIETAELYNHKYRMNNGKITMEKSVVKYLNNVVKALTGRYFISRVANMSEMEAALYVGREETSTPFQWVINKAKLYDTVKEFYPERLEGIEIGEFVEYGDEEINALIIGDAGRDGLLKGCRLIGHLLSSNVTRPTEIREEKTEETGNMIKVKRSDYVRKNWADITKDIPEDVLDKKYHDKKIFDSLKASTRVKRFNKLGLVVDGEDGKQYTLKAEVVKDVDGNVAKDKDGNEKVQYYYERPQTKTTKGKYGKATVTFNIDSLTLGEELDLVYKNEYPLQGIDDVESERHGIIKDSQYKGMYVMTYFDPEERKTGYVITRNIFSAQGHGSRYWTLDDALDAIDRMNANDKLIDHALIAVKSPEASLSKVKIEDKNISTGQVLSVLDYDLDNYSLEELPQAVYNLLKRNGRYFHKTFDSDLGTDVLFTPEMCAAYVIKQYESLYVNPGLDKVILPDNMKAFEDAIRRNHLGDRQKWDKVVSDIATAGKVHYRVKSSHDEYNRTLEFKYYNAALEHIPYGGAKVDITGNKVGEKPMWQVIRQTLEETGKVIGKNYFKNIRIMSSGEMLADPELSQYFNEFTIDTVKAFVHNGVMYINSSNGSESDLYHELTHIMMGVVKKNDYDAYEELLNYVANSDDTRGSFNAILNNLGRQYKSMALNDRMEEALARFIAKAVSDSANGATVKSSRLAKSVDGVMSDLATRAGASLETFRETAGFVLETVNKIYGMAKEKGNKKMTFMSWLKNEAGSPEVRDRRIVTNLVKNLIETNKITKSPEC